MAAPALAAPVPHKRGAQEPVIGVSAAEAAAEQIVVEGAGLTSPASAKAPSP